MHNRRCVRRVKRRSETAREKDRKLESRWRQKDVDDEMVESERIGEARLKHKLKLRLLS